MKAWFGRRDEITPPVVAPEEVLDAYKDGRKDERVHLEHEVRTPRIDKADVKEAYERGRRDERARHKSSPVMALIVLLIAVIGVGGLYLAAKEGSFTGGGAVVDRNLNTASQTVQQPVRNAAENAGTALENAGQNLKQAAKP